MARMIREELEEREALFLSPFAALSSRTKGRLSAEEECPLRPAFQHDRDRIIHSKSFRRLKHKTQVFLIPAGDHYRTRLTHALEVSQIARTISKALRLNEDLTEAISLGHDLGHTPFGHAGEELLNQVVPGGFNHSDQSLRVVDRLEKEGRGLNLTFEVRDGILKHSKGRGEILCDDPEEMAATLEGQVVRIADIIAYINHDIDDAIRGGVISQNDIPKGCLTCLGDSHSKRINTMVNDIILETLRNGGGRLAVREKVLSSMVDLRGFLWERVYENETVHGEFHKATKILKELYHHFADHPDTFLKLIERESPYDSLERCISDFLAGMTDRYAFSLYEKLFLPLPWIIL
ncbi:MAG: deoxyguanosinetriphosphate triphosphohydrolase [Deltaproteobacteria bacterium RBG_13_52_11b]|nr:MAG: deoxyguanosinetriphosphate triphosphohydrolase [Deltaproteobacteria bacterium RBG_13_52_11b]